MEKGPVQTLWHLRLESLRRFPLGFGSSGGISFLRGRGRSVLFSVRDSTGEHRILKFKSGAVCADERRARNYTFEAGREVLVDYGPGIASIDIEVIRHALDTFEASFAIEEMVPAVEN
jgi:hypothetical protein